jgi:hypothetical protein
MDNDELLRKVIEKIPDEVTVGDYSLLVDVIKEVTSSRISPEHYEDTIIELFNLKKRLLGK